MKKLHETRNTDVRSLIPILNGLERVSAFSLFILYHFFLTLHTDFFFQIPVFFFRIPSPFPCWFSSVFDGERERLKIVVFICISRHA